MPVFLLLLYLAISCKQSESATGTNNKLEQFSTDVEESNRNYSVFIPKRVKETNKAAGLIFLFHGSNGTGENLSIFTGFNAEANKENLITVYPDAAVGNWAEGCQCNNADRLKIKDIEFTREMMKEIKSKYFFPERKVFAVGFSQGGLFAQRLACEMSGEISGFGIVAATISVPLAMSCEPSEKVSQLIIQGQFDTILPYNGSNNGALSLLSAKKTARFWATKNECGSDSLTTSSDTFTETIDYCESENHSSIQLITARAGNHNWFFPGVNTNQELINFFLEIE